MYPLLMPPRLKRKRGPWLLADEKSSTAHVLRAVLGKKCEWLNTKFHFFFK